MDSDDGSDDGSAGGMPTQGLGSAVSRILGKDVAAADPVLAKRKTPMMREIDEERAARKQQKQRRLEKAERRAVLAAPAGDEEAVREKAMRKTATKAVIVLFNAIAQRQKPKRPEPKPLPGVRSATMDAIDAAAEGDGAAEPANAWARDDYLLNDDEEDAWGCDDAEGEAAPTARKTDDGAAGSFLYDRL